MYIEEMWKNYLLSLGEDSNSTDLFYESWHFGNNEKDANELAQLTRQGIKQATSSLLDSFKAENEPLPKENDLHIITDWNKQPVCIIKISKVEIVKFKNITKEHAGIEGEGDLSLSYWRNCHLKYFKEDAKELGFSFTEDSYVVFMIFESVFAKDKRDRSITY
jgi:uncharacterized protein YhfF